MIRVYATEVEAYDVEANDLIFKMKMFDAEACHVEIKTVLAASNFEEVVQSMRDSMKLMGIGDGTKEQSA